MKNKTMKGLNIIILIFLVNINCKAQIIDRFENNILIGEVNNAYYKDVNGFRDRFVGIWEWSDGNNVFTVVFQKRDNLYNNNGLNNYFLDVLVGEYRYIENNIEKINTINNININYGSNYNLNATNHNLSGYRHLRYFDSFPHCNECLPNEKRMVFSYTEPNYDAMGIASNQFVVRYFVESGVEKIKVWFYDLNQIVKTDQQGNEILPAPYKLPFGEYILIKQ